MWFVESILDEYPRTSAAVIWPYSSQVGLKTVPPLPSIPISKRFWGTSDSMPHLQGVQLGIFKGTGKSTHRYLAAGPGMFGAGCPTNEPRPARHASWTPCATQHPSWFPMAPANHNVPRVAIGTNSMKLSRNHLSLISDALKIMIAMDFYCVSSANHLGSGLTSQSQLRQDCQLHPASGTCLLQRSAQEQRSDCNCSNHYHYQIMAISHA